MSTPCLRLPVIDLAAHGRWHGRGQALVFFHQPNDDALVECLPTCLTPGAAPRYRPVTSGEHLRLKINRHFTPARQAD